MDDVERNRLIKALEEFDPSDDYHAGEYRDAGSYYAAIDRAVHLLRGNITTWTDPKPTR